MGRQDTRYEESSMPSLLRVPTPQDFLCGLVSHLHLPPSPTSSSTWISHIIPCVERISNQHLGVRCSMDPLSQRLPSWSACVGLRHLCFTTKKLSPDSRELAVDQDSTPTPHGPGLLCFQSEAAGEREEERDVTEVKGLSSETVNKLPGLIFPIWGMGELTQSTGGFILLS